jgi:hypothetical protein
MCDPIKRQSGAQPGNHNARKHGFYSKALTGEEKRNLKYASGIEGLDQEIAIFRVKLNSLLSAEGENQLVINRTAETLARLYHFKVGLACNDGSKLKEALHSVLGEFSVPETRPDPAAGPSEPSAHA